MHTFIKPQKNAPISHTGVGYVHVCGTYLLFSGNCI